jgi:hypothetical protein
MSRVAEMNIRKIFMIILIVVVSILVVMAFYSNRDRFSGLETVKYVKINLSSPVSAFELADKYSDSRSKDRFVSELKKVNGLSSTSSIDKSTVLIPVFESN